MDNHDTCTGVYRKLGIRVLRYKGHDDLKSKENRRCSLDWVRTDEGTRLRGGAFCHGGGMRRTRGGGILRRTRGRGMRWSTGDKVRDGG